jgi:hypothetical protein
MHFSRALWLTVVLATRATLALSWFSTRLSINCRVPPGRARLQTLRALLPLSRRSRHNGATCARAGRDEVGQAAVTATRGTVELHPD